MKTCTRCGTEKELSEFSKRSSSKDGHATGCKLCKREYDRFRVDEGLNKTKKRIESKRKYAQSNSGKEQKRKWRQSESGKEVMRVSYVKRKIKSPIKVAARMKVNEAIRGGRLKRLPCEVCKSTKIKSEAHHCDYAKPLDVNWLCPDHHREWHRNNEVLNG